MMSTLALLLWSKVVVQKTPNYILLPSRAISAGLKRLMGNFDGLENIPNNIRCGIYRRTGR